MAIIVYIHGFDCFGTLKDSQILSGSSVNEMSCSVLEDVAEIFRTYLPIKAATFLFIDTCEQAPLILTKMQDPKSLKVR